MVRKTGLSSKTGFLSIMSEQEYLRATASYVVEWTVFGMLGSLPILIPLFAWVSIATQVRGELNCVMFHMVGFVSVVIGL